jgi:hypothetical protein
MGHSLAVVIRDLGEPLIKDKMKDVGVSGVRLQITVQIYLCERREK